MLYVHLYVKYLQTFLDVVYGLIDYTNKECAEVMFYIPPLCDICIHVFLLNSQKYVVVFLQFRDY